ncbi:MAG: hypothetical protein Q7S21_05200 [archaeon]|nr:hypothetical protein [archaeon]
MILVTEQDIINTYSEYDRFSCKKYFEYQELMNQNPFFGYKKCAKLLEIPQGRVRWWHTKGSKKGKPIPLKTIDKLKQHGFLPFDSNNEHIESILRILGTLFGDGGIDCRLNTMSFISSHKEEVELWKNDLIKIFPFAENKINIREGGEYGHSYCIRTFDRSVIRFFVALGTPVGSKVVVPYSLPKYLNSLDKKCKIAFFDGLFSSEIAIPRFVKSPYITNYFKNFSLGLSKSIELEQSHKDFFEEMQLTLKSLGIQSTGHIRKDLSLGTLRKDGIKSCMYGIFFRVNLENIFKFHKMFPLKYSIFKKAKFDGEIAKAMENQNTHY